MPGFEISGLTRLHFLSPPAGVDKVGDKSLRSAGLGNEQVLHRCRKLYINGSQRFDEGGKLVAITVADRATFMRS